MDGTISLSPVWRTDPHKLCRLVRVEHYVASRGSPEGWLGASNVAYSGVIQTWDAIGGKPLLPCRNVSGSDTFQLLPMVCRSLAGNHGRFCRDASGAKCQQKAPEKTFQAAKNDANNISEQARSKSSVAEYLVVAPATHASIRAESMCKEQEVAHIQIERQKFEDLLKLQDTVTRRRIFLDNDRRRNTAEQQSVLDAMGSFMDNADALVASSVKCEEFSGKGVQLQRSWSRVREVTDHFKSQSLALQKDEHELSLLETRLRRKEQEVYDGRSGNLPSNDAEDQLNKADDGSSSEIRSNEDDPLVSQYYACLGKFNDLRDSLINYEANYRRRVYQRQRKRAKGESFDLSDSAFEAKHVRKRNARLAELVATRKELDHLADQCSEQALHVEKHQLPALGDDNLLNQFERFPQIILDYISSNNTAVDDVDKAAALVSGSLDKENRIATWLGQVDHEPPRAILADGHDMSLAERSPICPSIHRH